MDHKTYLEDNARKLDAQLYDYLFAGASALAVLDELAKFQNSDGGFGHGLEPDLRLPDSSALATTVALQYLDKLDMPAGAMLDQAIAYLIKSYDHNRQGWIIIPPAADTYPPCAMVELCRCA